MKSFFDLSYIKMRFLSRMEKMYKFSWYFLGTERRTWCSLFFCICILFFLKRFLNVHFDDKASWGKTQRPPTQMSLTSEIKATDKYCPLLSPSKFRRERPWVVAFHLYLASQLRGYVEHKKCYFSHTSHCVWPSNIWLKYLVHYPPCCKKPGIFNPDKNTHLKITQKAPI